VGAEEGYLFGSRARGDHLENSDVDLLIISRRFAGLKFPWRLIALQEHWDLLFFLEALPYTREKAETLAATRGVVAEALSNGIRILPAPRRQRTMRSDCADQAERFL